MDRPTDLWPSRQPHETLLHILSSLSGMGETVPFRPSIKKNPRIGKYDVHLTLHETLKT